MLYNIYSIPGIIPIVSKIIFFNKLLNKYTIHRVSLYYYID